MFFLFRNSERKVLWSGHKKNKSSLRIMSKKFFDILPPRKILEKPQLREFRKKTPEKKFSSVKPRIKSFSKKITFFLISILLIFGTFLFFTLKRAEIEIMPETELIDFEKKVLLDSQFKEPFSVWLTESKIPSEIISEEKSAEREFSATGEVLVEANEEIDEAVIAKLRKK